MTVRPRRRAALDLRALVLGLLSAAVFAGAIVLVVVNQQTVGWLNLGLMLLGLAVLVGMLALYNRSRR